MFKSLRFGLPLSLALCVGASVANAQSFDAFFGVGTAMDNSSKQSIDTFGTGSPFTTPALAGAFGKAGADFFFKPQFGVNAETDFRFSQGAYTGLTYRPTFYDFNGVWRPMIGRFHHIEPIIEAGVGGMNMKFFESASACDAFAGCASSTQYLESSNHFQVHLSAGIRMYATHHIFIQPQVDAHYVNNLFQFGSNWVPEYSASVGYSFGER